MNNTVVSYFVMGSMYLAKLLDLFRPSRWNLSLFRTVLVWGGLLFFTPAHAVPQGLRYLTNPEPASGFRLTDLEGKPRSLSDYRGKVLIVNFWATWCIPCIKEMPALQRASNRLGVEDIHVIAINMGESRENVSRFQQRQSIQFPLLLDPDTQVSTAWSVLGLPTTYVVDPNGLVVIRVVGEYEWDDPDFLSRIRELKKIPPLNNP